MNLTNVSGKSRTLSVYFELILASQPQTLVLGFRDLTVHRSIKRGKKKFFPLFQDTIDGDLEPAKLLRLDFVAI